MSYTSLPAFKLFQLTSLSFALALAGCGGGDGTDIIAPKPDIGVQPGTGGGNNNGGGNNGGDNGGTQTPIEEDFILPGITVNPILVEFSDNKDEPTVFTATVKAVKSTSFSAMPGKEVSLKVEPSENSGVLTIEGESTQVTDVKGDAIYELKLNPQRIKDETALIEKGFTLTATSIKADGTIVKQVRKVTVFKKVGGDSSIPPVIELDILNAFDSFDNQVGYILNSAGGTTTIQTQLNNQSSGSQIADQSIRFTLDDKKLASLLKVNGSIGSAVIAGNTDSNGIASFKVDVGNDLTPSQKLEFDQKVLTATLTETFSGKQKQVKIKIQSMMSAISLIPQQSQYLNLNGGETQIEVIAKNNDGNVVAGQKIFLALPAIIASKGVTLMSGGSQTTDNSGRAIFTIAVPNSLTDIQKDAIGNSFAIALSAADSNNNIVTETGSVTTIRPVVSGTQENLSIGVNKVVNTKGDTFKVFVRVENDGRAINKRSVNLEVDNPIQTGVSVINGTALTNSDGVATFDLKLEPGANVNQAILEAGIRLTAFTTTAENVKLEQNYIVAVDTATIDSYQILASSDKSTLNTGGDQTNATFRVTDSSGGILVGVPVQLSIDSLEASGAALTTPSIVTTDDEGKVDVGILLAANSINARLNHEVKITAKIVTPVYDANGNVSMDVREEKLLSLSATGTVMTLNASKTQLKDAEATIISTTLIDGAGRAIANTKMDLVNATGQSILPKDSSGAPMFATTDADGNASFELNEAALKLAKAFDDNGNLRIFARAIGEKSLNTQTSINSINLVQVSQAGISFGNIESPYDVNVSQTINVQIRTDSAAEALALQGKVVEVQTTIGTFINNDVIISRPIATGDITGNIITIPVVLTSKLAGSATLEAKVLGVFADGSSGALKYQTTADTRFRATTPTKMLFQAVKSVITPGSSTEIVATVKDKNDVPVEGQIVVFSRAADSSAGRLSAATGITDRKGEARVVYTSNASSPIGGVVINGRLLNDSENVGTKTTNITVSEEAVYATLAFANKLSSDEIYYTVRGSISVMDGSGRAVPNKEVSIKSYAVEYAQGLVCLLDSTTTYQAADEIERNEKGDIIKVTTPEPKVFSERTPNFLQSGWKPTEDSNYNYTLDKDNDPTLNEDKNGNNSLDAINPVAIIGGTLSDDGYTFVTDDEGRADFEIRYPMRYSNWVKVRFDATTFLNGSESTQSINYTLPSAESDLVINNTSIQTPWIDNTSPFGHGGAVCTSSMNIKIDDQLKTTRVILSPYQPNQPGYSVSIDGVNSNSSSIAYNSFITDFSQAFSEGSRVSVRRNGFDFSKTLTFK